MPLGPEARAVLSAIPREEDNPWVIAVKDLLTVTQLGTS